MKRIQYSIPGLTKSIQDSSHNSIEKGLQRKGVSDQVRWAIMEMYKDAKITITVGG